MTFANGALGVLVFTYAVAFVIAIVGISLDVRLRD